MPAVDLGIVEYRLLGDEEKLRLDHRQDFLPPRIGSWPRQRAMEIRMKSLILPLTQPLQSVRPGDPGRWAGARGTCMNPF